MVKSFDIKVSGENCAKAAEVMKTRLKERGFSLSDDGARVIFDTDRSLPEGAFAITEHGESVVITACDKAGFLHGAGKFLRGICYTKDGAELCVQSGVVVPECSVRGIYFASHFHNFYHVATLPEIERYLEDLALWGYNYLMAVYPAIDLESETSPEFKAQVKRLADLLNIAKKVGLKTCTTLNVNTAYKDYPREYAIVPLKDELGRHGNSGNVMCLSKPGAQEYVNGVNDRYLAGLAGSSVDMLMVWPYDEGGCGCESCSPWGANGYIRGSKQAFTVSKKHFPDAARCVSTWTFDTPYEGEWEALTDSLKNEKWCDLILAGAHEDFPRYPLEKGVPGGLPLISFPEISMWGLFPWGGFGATALPERFTRLWRQTEGKLDGGFAYSEGIFEDINKAIISGLYFNGKTEPEDTLKAYAGYELGIEKTELFVQLISLIEKTHESVALNGFCDPEDASKAYSLACMIDNELSPEAKRRWRWRQVYLRALVDARRYRIASETLGKDARWGGWEKLLADDAEVQAAFREIIGIYHCMEVYDGDMYHCRVRPPCR
jgi:hypothetical protein